MNQNRSFKDKAFKGKNGKQALTARPNLPIIIWAVAAVAAKLVSHGTLHDILNFIAFTAIVMWAVLEITKGVNYFRRALGLAVLIFTLYHRLH